ncbi:hypothetical protein ACEPAI_2982 [Sanghuangporus weigelae]
MTVSANSSVNDAADAYVLARVALRPLVSNLDTEHLMDCWRILQRSSADAAVLPSSASNLFAFADSCIYIASVHDLNFAENAEKKSESERQQAEEEAFAGGRAALKELSFSSAYRQGNLAKTLHMAFSNNNSQPPASRCENDPLGETNWQAQASSSSTSNISHAAGNAEADQYRITPYYINSPDGKHLATVNSDRRVSIRNVDSGELVKELFSDDDVSSVGFSPDGRRIVLGGDETSIWDATTDVPHSQEQIIPDELNDLNNFDMTIPEEPPIENVGTNSKSAPSDLIGIAYLYTASDAASAACEVSLGLALLPHARGRGCGTETVRQLIELAFDELNFHRISAGVIGPSLCRAARPTISNAASGAGAKQPNAPLLSGTIAETEAALRMFIALGFTLEGTRRRAIPDIEDNGVWRDAHYLALLDTDWFMLRARQNAKGVNPKNRRTRWDEMLARHQLETDALISAESRMKRSASTETLRPGAQTNGAAIGINLAPSSVSGSSAPSEVASGSGAGMERGKDQGREGLFSSARTSSNPFSTFLSVSSSSPNFFPSDHLAARVLQPRRKLTFTFGGDSESASQAPTDVGDTDLRSDNEELLIDFDEAHEKVEDFLRKNPAPGPPPSEAGTNLDSEADSASASASDFESCADPDELDLLGGGGNTKGKGKAKEVDPPVQDVSQGWIHSLSAGASIPATNLDIPRQKEPSTSVSPPDESEAEEQQARKKRRFSNGVKPEQDRTTRSKDCVIAPGMLPPTSTGTLHGASRPFGFSFNSSGFSFNTPRLVSSPTDVEAGQVADTLSSSHHELASANAEPHRSPNADHIADADSEMSDAESVSTASTWDVVSSASAPRSPSPTMSLSSGTGSLSLQSASESEDE